VEHRSPESPAALAEALRGTGYLADEGLATAAFLALRMRRPLFCEGEPGTGKTALAQALATVLGAELVRLQCYEGLDASQALYDWDFPRQLLHLRTLEATAASRVSDTAAHSAMDVDVVEASLYDRRFLLARPILRALQSSPAVLLVDEIDRADDEFEAFLLEVLTEYAVSIPELGEVRAADPRGPRRSQAALPLPLAEPPGRRPRDRDPARAHPRAARAARRRGGRRCAPAA
jgi:MoxR-like ATPase